MVIRYEQYGRKQVASKLIITTGKLWKWFGKYRRKLWKDRENMEENGEKIGKMWKKIVKWFGKHRRKFWKDIKNMEEK
jgi:hypothetical protein